MKKHIIDFSKFNEDISNIDDSFLIQIERGQGSNQTRTFFAMNNKELTWRKESAWAFNTEDDAKKEIRDNRMLELLIGNNYKIVKYSDAKNH